MSEYTLHHGDCLAILPTLEPQSVDAIICDPPYGTTACKWDSVIPFEPMWAGIRRVLKPRGACVLFGSQPFTSALVMSNVGWFKYELSWDKGLITAPGVAKMRPLPRHENILIFGNAACTYHPQMTRGRSYTKTTNTPDHGHGYGFRNRHYTKTTQGERYPSSVIHMTRVMRTIHPTQKPLALLEYLVKTYTNEGDTVLDFAMGSGTCGAACGNLDRRFIGIEKDAGYYAIAEERIATAYAPLRLMQVAG